LRVAFADRGNEPDAREENSQAKRAPRRETDSETKELDMATFAYSRCLQCDEENFFTDGSKCARCLGMSHVPVDDEDSEYEAEESLSISLDRPVAA
jgi:hypothetical protein